MWNNVINSLKKYKKLSHHLRKNFKISIITLFIFFNITITKPTSTLNLCYLGSGWDWTRAWIQSGAAPNYIFMQCFFWWTWNPLFFFLHFLQILWAVLLSSGFWFTWNPLFFSSFLVNFVTSFVVEWFLVNVKSIIFLITFSWILCSLLSSSGWFDL